MKSERKLPWLSPTSRERRAQPTNLGWVERNLREFPYSAAVKISVYPEPHGGGTVTSHRLSRHLIKRLLSLATGAFLLCGFARPSAGADKVRVAYSATTPTQGVLW